MTTTDGYKLTVFRIFNKNRSTIGKQPIFIQHGFLADATLWVSVGNRSLGNKNIKCNVFIDGFCLFPSAFHLVDMGFDVWLGNYRGTIYGLSHTKLKQTQDTFWDFR